jgi:hypothetical protein
LYLEGTTVGEQYLKIMGSIYPVPFKDGRFRRSHMLVVYQMLYRSLSHHSMQLDSARGLTIYAVGDPVIRAIASAYNSCKYNPIW